MVGKNCGIFREAYTRGRGVSDGTVESGRGEGEEGREGRGGGLGSRRRRKRRRVRIVTR